MEKITRNQIQAQIVQSIPSPPHGLALLSPRVGKTKIGIDIIKREKPKSILWVTPSTKLRDKDIPEEFIKWRAKTYLKKTNVVCYASLSKVQGNYDLVVLDEYQDVSENNTTPFFNGTITYKSILGLSGTHPKHKEKQNILDKFNLKVVKKMTIDEAVESKLIAPYEITVIETNLDSKEKYIKAGSKKKPFLNTEFNQYKYLTRLINIKLFNRETVPTFFYLNRMRFIYNLKSKTKFAKDFIDKLEGRTLIFAGSIEQSQKLCEYTFNSKTSEEALETFMNEKINRLACVNSGGVGFTFRNVQNFVIVQVNSNKKGDATQKIARSLVLQENYKANIYIIVVRDTVDEKWKDLVLKDFDINKVKHVSYRNYIE